MRPGGEYSLLCLTQEYRYEGRRDYSNQPSFLSDVQGVLSKQQNTATLGLVWWWGRKEARGDRTRISFPETSMQDLLWIVVTVAFFAVSIAYVHFCERVK